jgi:hypothetical protein
VMGELHEAGRLSVWNPNFRRTYGWVAVMSTFAMVFSVAGDQKAARSLFTALGHLAGEWPWTYLGDPATAVRERRQMAGVR